MSLNQTPFPVLDHGYIRFIESWGRGDAGVPEAGVIEAARQSTQGSFRDWHPYKICEKCDDWVPFSGVSAIDHHDCEHEWKMAGARGSRVVGRTFSTRRQRARRHRTVATGAP